MEAAFYQSEADQPHPGRARAIIKAHPEVRQLMVRNPWTALLAVSIVILQTGIAYGMGTLGFSYWWLIPSVPIPYAIPVWRITIETASKAVHGFRTINCRTSGCALMIARARPGCG